MIVALSRLLAALVGWLLLVVCAVAGIAAAAFSVQGGTDTLSYANAAQLADLAAFRDTVGAWLDGLAGGGTDTVAGLAGIGAVLLGLVLLTGAVVASRERLLVIERSPKGTIAVRRRAAAGALAALAVRPRDAVAARAKVRTRRRRVGGSARLRVDRARTADGPAVGREARQAATPLAEALSVRLRVRDAVPRRRGRVR